MACTFQNNDGAYLEWIRTHPDGFVVNTGYMLHKANCSSISRTYLDERHHPYTGHYTKTCLVSAELREFLAQYPNIGKCSKCNP